MDRAVKNWKLLSLFVLFLSACTLSEQTGDGVPSLGLIITPPSYYSTRKAKALGQRYKQHLEQLLQELVDHPLTGKLQFANNIASVGGIGFFTHSAGRSPDERYLEVVLGVPDVFDDTVDLNSKVNRLFSLYGFELLSILVSDADIYGDKDVAGYGLNLSWRATSEVSGRRRVALERAVIYVSKQESRRFLDYGDSQTLLEASVIFAVGADGLPRQFAYGRPEAGREQRVVASEEGIVGKQQTVARPELEPDILEQDLSPGRQPEQPPAQSLVEKTPPRKRPKEAAQDQAGIREKGITEKAAPKLESTPERRTEVGKKAPDRPKEAVRESSPPVEVVKQVEPHERKVEPKSVLEEKTPKQAQPSPEEAKDKTSSEKRQPKLESKPEEPKEVAKRATELPKDAVKEPSPAVEFGKKGAEPPEEKVAPRFVLKESPQKPAEQQIKDRVGTEKAIPGVESKAERRRESVETVPDASKEQLKPSPAVEIAKRTALPEEKEQPKLTLKEEIPGAVEGKLPEPQLLQGYLVQFLFSERAEAERWSELLSQEGYSTSMNMIQGNKLVRLRIGPFPSATEASRLLEKRQREGLTGMVLFHMAESQSLSTMKRAGKKPGMVLPEKAAVEQAKAREEKRMERPETGKKDGEAIVSRSVQKKVPDIKPPEPKAGTNLPEKKEQERKKTEPKVVLRKRVPAPVEEKQPVGESPKVQGMHGYLVQISFLDTGEAERWSELLTQEGYSISMSRIRGKESVRLRIGAFPSSTEAQGLLKKLQKQGLRGFVVQAPK